MPSQKNDAPSPDESSSDALSSRLSKLTPAQRLLLQKRLAQKSLNRPEPSSALPGRTPLSSATGASRLQDVQDQASTSKASPSPVRDDDVVVVGMGCRLPGADNPNQFWDLIRSGRQAVGPVPSDRWDKDRFYDATGRSPGKMSVDRIGAVKNVAKFDPSFFGIAPREAARMDPQQRLLLEVVWETFEDAGIPADQIAGSKTGVFIGIGGTDYSKVPSQYPNYFEQIDAHIGTGNALSIAAGRVSYLFDLRGPSFIVDTACSSALVAIHNAVVSLRRGETDSAIAGGVNLILTPETTIAFSKARMLSPDGECRPFDDSANGYVRGEGCGVVMLKRYRDALDDGDRIVGVIRGSAVNQDGRTSGITAPSSDAQVRVIREAHQDARVAADDVSYVEAHGTGTPLGDPIEMAALDQVFARRGKNVAPVRVGSVKGNIGHTETVSGIAGLLKVLLMHRHGEVPAQPNFQTLNSNIRIKPEQIRIADRTIPWSSEAGDRVAGVSSFGFGGTNAHLIVQGPPISSSLVEPSDAALVRNDTDEQLVNAPEHNAWEALLVSARDENAVSELTKRYSDLIQQESHSLHDIAASSSIHRSALPQRLAVLADSPADACARLSRALNATLAGNDPHVIQGRPPSGRRCRVALVFPGQGSQYIGMGQGLLASNDLFRRSMAACAGILDPLLPSDLLRVLDGSAGDLNHTSLAQPAICAVQCSLVDVLRDAGVKPDVVAGHSIGEIAALYAAGTIDRTQAMLIAFYRGQVMGDLREGGTMAALLCPAGQVEQWISESGSTAVVAAMNGPDTTVIAGSLSAVADVSELASSADVAVRPLDVSHAFHSPLMQPAVEPLREKLSVILKKTEVPTRVKFISSVFGGRHQGAVGVDYWLDHLVSPVRFTDVLNQLVDENADVTIEVGPKSQIVGMIRRSAMAKDAGRSDRLGEQSYASILNVDANDHEGLMRALSKAWCSGASVDWKKVHRDRPFRRVALPLYPFQRSTYWYDPPTLGSVRGELVHPLLGSVQELSVGGRVFSNVLRENSPAYLADHVVSGSVTVPAAAWIEMMASAAEHSVDSVAIALEDVSIHKAVFLESAKPVSVQTHVDKTVSGRCKIQVSIAESDSAAEDSAADAKWTVVASSIATRGTLATVPKGHVNGQVLPSLPPAEFYKQAEVAGLKYEPLFQTLTSIQSDDSLAKGELSLASDLQHEARSYRLHPTLLDGALQLIGVVIHAQRQSGREASDSPVAYLPAGVSRILFGQSRQPVASAAVKLLPSESEMDALADVVLRDKVGDLVAVLHGVKLSSLRRETKRVVEDPSSWFYETKWTTVESPRRATSGDLKWDPCGPELQVMDGDRPHWVWSNIGLDDETCVAQRTHVQTSKLLRAIQLALKEQPSPIVSVVTKSAFAIGASESVDPTATAIAGVVRSATNECPHLNLRYLDVSGDDVAHQVNAWLSRDGDDETELALRSNQFYAPRLDASPTGLKESGEHGELLLPLRGNYRIRLDGTNRLEGLWAQRMPTLVPIEDEVRVRITDVGLNFSDVLKAMGLYPGITDVVVPMGIEICGVVEAVGPDTHSLKPGMRVMGIVPHGFSSADKTNEYLLTAVPDGLSDDEAAGVPIVFLTAHHALINVARLGKGEKVLVHAGAGGVGLAAIQVAQSVGAEVFTTAGSDDKRQLLANLGVPSSNIFDSRDLGSIEAIRESSGGIDVVLNSLPGDWIDRSLSLLNAHGRFLEIGKIDIYGNRGLGLLPFQDNLTYSAIDLDRLLRQRPAEVTRLFSEINQQFTAGAYRPLPTTRYRLSELPAAMNYMAARKNIGKIVVRTPSMADDVAVLPGTHLITGGSGAIGLAAARRLIERGAACVDLVGRREVTGKVKDLQAFAAERDALVIYHCGDASDAVAVQSVVQTILDRGQGIVGVVHAAGVLSDGLIQGMTAERFASVLRPKVDATMALHEATADLELDYFTMLGSVATVLGSPGQSNYAAANAFLEGLAVMRRQQGRPASVVHWGPWDSDGGGMADDEVTKRNLAASGLRPLEFDVAIDVLLDAALYGAEEAPKDLVVVDADWRKLLKNATGSATPSRLRGLTLDRSDGEAASHGARDEAFLARLAGVKSDDQSTLLRGYLGDLLGAIMGMAGDSIDPEQPLGSLGLDSLLAIELKNTIETKLAVELPISRFMDEPSLNTLVSAVDDFLSTD